MPWAPLVPCAGGCGRKVTSGRCRDCRRAYEVARGSRQQRGLGAEYERERRAVLKDATHCARCGKTFTATRRPTAGHIQARVQGGGSRGNLQPECTGCNYGDGAKLARAAR